LEFGISRQSRSLPTGRILPNEPKTQQQRCKIWKLRDIQMYRTKKIHPDLKHGGYAAFRLLAGEDPDAFNKLHNHPIDELAPSGPTASKSPSDY
jgi:hypothetical protein